MDIIQDRRLLLNNYKSDENVLKTVFADLNGLIDANIYQFSFYATMVKMKINTLLIFY